MSVFVRVALDHPLATLFDYRYDLAPTPLPGMLVRIPFGRRDAVGLICEVTDHTDVPVDKLRDVAAICSTLAPLADEWRALTLFAAEYYQRGLGEVALPALPQVLRDASRWTKLLAPEERYRLMPYLYALAEQNSRTGDPIMRPVFYDYPDALKSDCDKALSFTLLFCFVVTPLAMALGFAIALAVNAGSVLTPLGNPQNLFLWQTSGVSFGRFVGALAPLCAALTKPDSNPRNKKKRGR